jgi:chromate transporter
VPEWSSLDPAAAAIAAGAFVALFRLRLGMIPTLALAVLAGVAVRTWPW